MTERELKQWLFSSSKDSRSRFLDPAINKDDVLRNLLGEPPEDDVDALLARLERKDRRKTKAFASPQFSPNDVDSVLDALKRALLMPDMQGARQILRMITSYVNDMEDAANANSGMTSAAAPGKSLSRRGEELFPGSGIFLTKKGR